MHASSLTLFELYAALLFTSEKRVPAIGPDKIPTTLQDVARWSGMAWDLPGIAQSPHLQINATGECDYPAAVRAQPGHE
jgi:hypothetical protein